MEHLNIETSQHVQINYLPAGVSSRVGAFLIDVLIMGIYLSFILLSSRSMAFTDGVSIGFFIALLPLFFYHLISEVLMEGQSLGKKALNIKVVKKNGRPPTLGSYLMRWIFRLIEISATSGTLAFFTILINGHGQRLGDIAAGTTVVKTKKRTQLSDTLYTDIEEGYNPQYPEASRLNDNDISVIKEVLNEANKYDRRTYIKIALKTKNAIRNKMGIELSDDIDTMDFLRRVVKDYNFIHR